MADITEIVDYYTNLLITQYHGKPKAKATIRLLVNELLAAGLLLDIRDGYNIKNAVGVQLDVIGKYVGVDRTYKGQDFSGYFSFINYDEVYSPPVDRIGFATYSDFETKVGKTLNYSSLISQNYLLSDDAYRTILMLKIVQNNSNHSHKSIDDSIYKFFGNNVIPDSDGGMRMYYFITTALNSTIQAALQKKVLPKPMGVGLAAIVQSSPFFGFATYSGYSPDITGFTTYAEYDTKAGEILNYSKLLT